MSTVPHVEEAIERAKRVQQERLGAIADVAHARDTVTQLRDRHEAERRDLDARHKSEVKDAENADVSAYNRALKLGWSSAELKQIGFSEPEKKRRTQRRQTKQRPDTETAALHGASSQDERAGDQDGEG